MLTWLSWKLSASLTHAHRLTMRLGKGQGDRLVPLTETAAHWLTRYVTAARPELAAGKLWGAVFPDQG